MTTTSLKIAGIEVSLAARLGYDQRLESFGGSSVRRMADGAAFKMASWRKWRISISADGWVPPALMAIDYDAPFEVELPMPIALNTGEPLPSGFTARLSPWAEHPFTDATGNTVRYVYIKATVIAEPPSQSNGSDAAPAWELVCEQV